MAGGRKTASKTTRKSADRSTETVDARESANATDVNDLQASGAAASGIRGVIRFKGKAYRAGQEDDLRAAIEEAGGDPSAVRGFGVDSTERKVRGGLTKAEQRAEAMRLHEEQQRERALRKLEENQSAALDAREEQGRDAVRTRIESASSEIEPAPGTESDDDE